jgi:hypothetical protein
MQTGRMIRMARRPVLLIVAAACVAVLAGCSSSGGTAIKETASVRHTESLVAVYARTHGGGREVGGSAGCEVREIGQSAISTTSTRVYIELLCSSLSGRPRCSRRTDTAFSTEAMATISGHDEVSGLLIDEENDAGEYQWVVRHFSPQTRHVEYYGPKYGDLLQTRLDKQYPC